MEVVVTPSVALTARTHVQHIRDMRLNASPAREQVQQRRMVGQRCVRVCVRGCVCVRACACSREERYYTVLAKGVTLPVSTYGDAYGDDASSDTDRAVAGPLPM